MTYNNQKSVTGHFSQFLHNHQVTSPKIHNQDTLTDALIYVSLVSGKRHFDTHAIIFSFFKFFFVHDDDEDDELPDDEASLSFIIC